MGGRESGQKLNLARFIDRFGNILLPSSNIGKEGKGG